eukprot:6200707-Pleurochrysis_carterae.AAC.10
MDVRMCSKMLDQKYEEKRENGKCGSELPLSASTLLCNAQSTLAKAKHVSSLTIRSAKRARPRFSRSKPAKSLLKVSTNRKH